jgi:hypothetical protein
MNIPMLFDTSVETATPAPLSYDFTSSLGDPSSFARTLLPNSYQSSQTLIEFDNTIQVATVTVVPYAFASQQPQHPKYVIVSNLTIVVSTTAATLTSIHSIKPTGRTFFNSTISIMPTMPLPTQSMKVSTNAAHLPARHGYSRKLQTACALALLSLLLV